MLVNKLNKTVEINTIDNICYQLMTYLFLKKISISNSGVRTLALLAIGGKQLLKEFCKDVYAQGIYSSEQSVRNILDSLEDLNLVVKEGKKIKSISINPDIELITEGNILLDFKILSRESS